MLIFKILMLLGVLQPMDPDGWVKVERPVKTPYYEEGEKGDPSEPQWTAFFKQTGKEKAIVMFPAVPTYVYEEGKMVVSSYFQDSSYQFEIHSKSFESAERLLEWRLEALKGQAVAERRAFADSGGHLVAELVYWDGENWIFEHWRAANENTYFQMTKTPLRSDEFHRQFLASFDLDQDPKMR